jgi:hypothetical protein
MYNIILLLLMLFSPYIKSNGFLLPDPKITPGAIRTADTAVYCHQPTSQVRNTSSALKDTIYKEYGWSLKKHPIGEIDHKVPLEVGGADIRENLWFQPAPEFKSKDSVENWVRKRVCSRQMSGVYAQLMFKEDWTHLYQHMKLDPPPMRKNK